ncbi:MAG: Asp-tRNA(Asn)/Glu-tRNA(Gln) amidotransferase subunit GatC [Lewinella sp.]|nr:Asp-tRNA(Asn)/Glu-tRNA(Gln) amidotransferase subunit GatC [Lewinella sp.]
MEIDDSLISRLAQLARLQLSPEERQTIRHDLNNILRMVEKLQDLDLQDVEPLAYLHASGRPLRPDEVQGQVEREAALRHAPDHDGAHFKVPKVIDL